MKKRPMSGEKSPKQRAKADSSTDTLFFEKKLYNEGVSLIAGVDEVGRGPLAGPVVAAAVIFPKNFKIEGVRDSKKLTPKKRDKLYEQIKDSAISYGIGSISPDEIDRINILKASLSAMRIAVDGLTTKPQHILIDGQFEIEHLIPQTAIKGGDDLSHSIAAASIVAKVTRDRMMCDFEDDFPGFCFSRHKGYGTKLHYEELSRLGPTSIHRKSFLKNL